MKIRIPIMYDGKYKIMGCRMINKKDLEKFKDKYPELEIIEA